MTQSEARTEVTHIVFACVVIMSITFSMAYHSTEINSK